MRPIDRILLALAATALVASPLMAQGASSRPLGSGAAHRIRILANGGYNTSALSFSDASTFTYFLEDATLTRSYDGGKGFVFEVGAIVGITGPLGVMGSVEIFDSNFDGQFQENLPHPLYFNQPRTVEGTIPGLAYKEKAVHVDAVFTRDLDKFTVDLFGGPTFFFTSTEILDAITVTSEYPFDEASLRGTTTKTVDDNPIGFNAGGSLTWHLTAIVGVAFQARYSKGSVQIAREGSPSIDLNAGGFHVGGGIRLAF